MKETFLEIQKDFQEIDLFEKWIEKTLCKQFHFKEKLFRMEEIGSKTNGVDMRGIKLLEITC